MTCRRAEPTCSSDCARTIEGAAMDRPLWLVLPPVCALVAGACGPPGTPPAHGSVVGSTAVAIDTRLTATRVGEAPIGNFIADTLLAAGQARGETPTLALVNSGAIRGGRTDRGSVPVTVDAK